MHILDVLQGLAHPDDAVADHTRVEAEGALDGVLGVGGGVEAHDEVVTGLVQGLVLAEGLGEQEGAPVGEAADDAVASEDDGAGGLGDPDGGSSRQRKGSCCGDMERDDCGGCWAGWSGRVCGGGTLWFRLGDRGGPG